MHNLAGTRSDQGWCVCTAVLLLLLWLAGTVPSSMDKANNKQAVHTMLGLLSLSGSGMCLQNDVPYQLACCFVQRVAGSVKSSSLPHFGCFVCCF